MAIWQVDFHIVPRRALATAPRPLTPAVLDDTDWWMSARFPVDYATRLAAVARAAPSWSPDLEIWGDEDGNRVDVWSIGGHVRSAVARVDVRRLDSKFGAALILLVRAADAVLVRRDGAVIEPTINAYAGALRGSAAWRHANDPATFLAAAESEDDPK